MTPNLKCAKLLLKKVLLWDTLMQQQQQHQQFFTRFHCYISAQTPYLPLTHNTYAFTATVNFYDLTPNNLLILYPTLSLFHTRRECHSVDLIKL